MKLLAPLCTILLAASLHAQDSPIIINDNGNVPPRVPDAKKTTPQPKAPLMETHIKSEKIKIQPVDGQFNVFQAGYKPVCLDSADHSPIPLADKPSWRIITLSRRHVTKISFNQLADGIEIDPPPGMTLRADFHLDDDDPTHKTTKLEAVIFHYPGGKPEILKFSLEKPITIHYCGPTGCDGNCMGVASQDQTKR